MTKTTKPATTKKKAAPKKNLPAKVTMDSVLKALNTPMYKGTVYKGKEIVRGGKIPTGSMKLNNKLNGGFVRGKLIECYALPSYGKSTLAYSLLDHTKGVKGFIDGESAYDKETAEMLGVDVNTLVVQKPDYLEQGLQMVIEMVDAGVETIIFDSIAGIPPKSELEDKADGTAKVGKKAYKMGELMRRLHNRAAAKLCTVFFINQVRDSMSQYGAALTTPGGHALAFHASYRLWISSIAKKIEKGKDNFVGHYMTITILKNKFGFPGHKVDVPLLYGYGVSHEWEIMDLAIDLEVIETSGTWFKYEDTTLAQGKYNLFTFMIDNPELLQDILGKIKKLKDESGESTG
jgi:recombination protein RecA